LTANIVGRQGGLTVVKQYRMKENIYLLFVFVYFRDCVIFVVMQAANAKYTSIQSNRAIGLIALLSVTSPPSRRRRH